MEYQCHKNNECMVDRVTRNRCQKCRFEKCLQVGMCRETVRLDKNRKRKAKDEDREAAIQETQCVMELLRAVNNAYTQCFSPNRRLATVEEAEAMVRRFLSLVPDFVSTVNGVDRDRLVRCGIKPFLVGFC
jgi:hypothetical protein